MLTSGLVLCVLAGVAGDGAPSVLQVAERGGFSLTQAQATSEPGMVRVHIESDHPLVELKRVGGTAFGGGGSAVLFQTVCNTPCDRIIDGRVGSFVLGGEGIRHSTPFQLSSYMGDLTLHVKAGDSLRGGLGAAGVALGVISAIVAVGGFVVGLTGTRDRVPNFIVGAVGLGATLVFGGGGLWLMSGAETQYRIQPGPPSAQPGGRTPLAI
jgi:hypothetical protein